MFFSIFPAISPRHSTHQTNAMGGDYLIINILILWIANAIKSGF